MSLDLIIAYNLMLLAFAASVVALWYLTHNNKGPH